MCSNTKTNVIFFFCLVSLAFTAKLKLSNKSTQACLAVKDCCDPNNDKCCPGSQCRNTILPGLKIKPTSCVSNELIPGASASSVIVRKGLGESCDVKNSDKDCNLGLVCKNANDILKNENPAKCYKSADWGAAKLGAYVPGATCRKGGEDCDVQNLKQVNEAGTTSIKTDCCGTFTCRNATDNTKKTNPGKCVDGSEDDDYKNFFVLGGQQYFVVKNDW